MNDKWFDTYDEQHQKNDSTIAISNPSNRMKRLFDTQIPSAAIVRVDINIWHIPQNSIENKNYFGGLRQCQLEKMRCARGIWCKSKKNMLIKSADVLIILRKIVANKRVAIRIQKKYFHARKLFKQFATQFDAAKQQSNICRNQTANRNM